MISRSSTTKRCATCSRAPPKDDRASFPCEFVGHPCCWFFVRAPSRRMMRARWKTDDARGYAGSAEVSSGDQHRCAAQFSGTQCCQRFVRLFEREGLGFGSNRNPRSDSEKLFAVAPGEIRDGTNRPLMREIAIGK